MLELKDKISSFLESGQYKATLVGRVISLDHMGKGQDVKVIEDFAQWMSDFIDRVENFHKK